MYGCILPTTWTHTTHNYMCPKHIFIRINRGTKPSCPICVQQNIYNPILRAHCLTKISLTLDLPLMPRDLAQQLRDTTSTITIQPWISRKDTLQQLRISRMTAYRRCRSLRGGKGVKRTPASCSRTTRGENCLVGLEPQPGSCLLR